MDSDSSHSIEVTVETAAWHSAVTDPDLLCRRAVAAVLQQEAAVTSGVEVGVMLADDSRVQVLNREFRGQDRPTNVLSFPTGELGSTVPGQPVLLGDIVLALETARREADRDGKPLGAHVTHLVVHGTLHLLGYDHEEDIAADLMEAREIMVLAGLGVADPYAMEAAS
jgi:probable rRNA maturation factor